MRYEILGLLTHALTEPLSSSFMHQIWIKKKSQVRLSTPILDHYMWKKTKTSQCSTKKSRTSFDHSGFHALDGEGKNQGPQEEQHYPE